MPYLRMFLGDQQIDEVFISEFFFNSILSLHIIDEEKQNLLKRHAATIQGASSKPVFCIDTIPSATNNFKPLKLENDERQVS